MVWLVNTARVAKNQKKPRKHRFTEFVFVPKAYIASVGRFQPGYNPSRGARVGGVSAGEIE
jgi:hypothetical protein